MEIRFVNDKDLRDFTIDRETADEFGITPGIKTGYSRVFESGMMIVLKDGENDCMIFISFIDVTRNEIARNLVIQVFPNLFGE